VVKKDSPTHQGTYKTSQVLNLHEKLKNKMPKLFTSGPPASSYIGKKEIAESSKASDSQEISTFTTS
jgi:hypothetical protein